MDIIFKTYTCIKSSAKCQIQATKSSIGEMWNECNQDDLKICVTVAWYSQKAQLFKVNWRYAIVTQFLKLSFSMKEPIRKRCPQEFFVVIKLAFIKEMQQERLWRTKKKWPSCMNTMFTTFTLTSEIPRAFQAFNFQLGLKCISIKEQVSLHIKSARN